MNDRDENFLIAERRSKLKELRGEGQAYPNDFRRDALADELHRLYGEHSDTVLESMSQTLRVAGRMVGKRVMGKASFAHLQDSSGRIQVYLQRDHLPEGLYKKFKTWDVGDLIGVAGTLFKTKTGELTVRADDARLLTKSLRPLPDKFHGLADQETRYRQRYLDLIVNEEARHIFKIRAEVVRYARNYLDALGFLEVETPMMQPVPGGALARPFVTHHNALDIPLYLRVAPELYLKRLVVGGFERVYEINRNFRNEGVSTKHNPEFTMLELYQAYADCDDIMRLTETLVSSMAESLFGTCDITYQGQHYRLETPFERMTVEESIRKHNSDLVSADLRDVDLLRKYCDRHDWAYEDQHGAGKLQIGIFEKSVERHLGGPLFITSYPAEVSPLARRNDADPFLTDRFEFFVAGCEIANGFSELNDPEDQAERFAEQAKARSGGDEEAMVFDADYLRALEYGLPPTGGLGVGIDRLVMLFTDSASIREVLLFPLLKPEV